MSATLSTVSQWAGLQREVLPFNSSIVEPAASRAVLQALVREHEAKDVAKPEPSADVLESWKRAGKFTGILLIPDAPFEFPLQAFNVSSVGSTITIESQPANSWPQVLIVMHTFDAAAPSVERVLLRPSDNSVEAELLYTRVLYTISETGSYFLASGIHENEVLAFRCEPFLGTEKHDLLYRAKLFRKLSFIENTFNQRFVVPENISPDQVRRIETLFRGITEGEVLTRGRDITVPVKANSVNLSEPPFSGLGPYVQSLGTQEAVLDHPRLLDTGPVYFEIKRAVVANQRLLEPLRNGRDSWVRFEVLDSQIVFRFEKYANPARLKRSQQRLTRFYFDLMSQEPPELARTLLELLTSDVLPAEASEIADGWIQYHNLPDRFSPQDPILDQQHDCWRVPIFLVFANGEHGHVTDLLIDLKTGSMIEEPSGEAVREEALAIAENILRAR